MPEILEKIPISKQEIIRDRIGFIITDELASQAALDPAEPDLAAVKVFLERIIPFQSSEMPCVNVMFAKGDFQGFTPKSSRGAYSYFIDCYTRAETEDTDRGDKLAAVKLQRLLFIIRSILHNSKYATLNFVAPENSIEHREVSGVVISEPKDDQDANNIMMGRLVLEVQSVESEGLVIPNAINGFETKVNLEETDKGYQFSNVPSV